MNSKYLINTALREYPDNIAINCDKIRITLEQLDGRVNRLANALLGPDPKKGELLRNCAAVTELSIGRADHEHILNDSAARAPIFDEEFEADFESLE